MAAIGINQIVRMKMNEKLMIFKIIMAKAKKTIIKVAIVVRAIMVFRIIQIEVEEEDIKTNVHLLQILIKKMVVLVISTIKTIVKLERTFKQKILNQRVKNSKKKCD